MPSTSSDGDVPVLTFEDLQSLNESVVTPWKICKPTKTNNCVKIEFFDQDHDIARFTLAVNSKLEYTIFVYNWPVPVSHNIYLSQSRHIKCLDGIEELTKLIENSSLCQGLPQDDDNKSRAIDPTWEEKVEKFTKSTIIRHSIPKVPSESHFQSSVTFRSPECEVILDVKIPDAEICSPCLQTDKVIKKAEKKKMKSWATPAKSKASLASGGPEKLRATLIATRLQNKQLEERLQQLEAQIGEKGMPISEGLEKDILKIMGGQNLEATPHMKFFWQQQMKLLQTGKMGRRYHPQIIRFALSLHGKSPAAYRELQDSGALILPSERVLRDYKNYFKPKAGLNEENIQALREKVASFTAIQHYVALVMDEMKIQSNLVFDKYTGDLIGFVDLGDPATNYATLGDEDVMATHALAFLVRGMCSDLKHVIAYYFTENVTSYQIMSVFWRIVGVLELSLRLRVVAAVNDGASANRKFFELHSSLVGHLEEGLVYKAINVFAKDRFIFFSLMLATSSRLPEIVFTILVMVLGVGLCGTMVCIYCLLTLLTSSTGPGVRSACAPEAVFGPYCAYSIQ